MNRTYSSLIRDTVCVDFDDTIYNWLTGELIEGAKEGINELRDMGYEIIISSCRMSALFKSHPAYARVVQHMIDFLCEHDIYSDMVDDGTNGKIVAEHYIDDK